MIESNDEHGAEYHLRKAGQLFRAEAGRAARAEHDVAHLREMLAKAREELVALRTEKVAVDNGDGTETAWCPVTYPKGLCVEGVRAPKAEDTYIADGLGTPIRCMSSNHAAYAVRLILRPAPKPPEPVTWEAPLVDGIWLANATSFQNENGLTWYWNSTGSAIIGLSVPPNLGKYQFTNGIGTLIEEAK